MLRFKELQNELTNTREQVRVSIKYSLMPYK